MYILSLCRCQDSCRPYIAVPLKGRTPEEVYNREIPYHPVRPLQEPQEILVLPLSPKS